MKKNDGFTLIEVLVALAILAIAIIAIIKSTTQNIRDTLYLQNKTIANWVGTEVVNEVRAGLLKPSSENDSIEQETEMLGRKWTWQASLQTTPNPHIKKIKVTVLDPSTHKKLEELESYVYVEATP